MSHLFVLAEGFPDAMDYVMEHLNKKGMTSIRQIRFYDVTLRKKT